MLPKVASHILQHTSRAAAAVQNQTTHTIRNVLQLQSSSGAGSSGSNGAGPGGAKFNPGSRYHHGYTGAGRAVTQANNIAAHDGTLFQSDDSDESSLKRVTLQSRSRPQRPRSHSVSISSKDRSQSLGVLETIQLHARARHAFAHHPLPTGSAVEEQELIVPARSVLHRRNSTSAPDAAVAQSFDALPLPLPPAQAMRELPSTDPSAPQTTVPPPKPEPSHHYITLKRARDMGDPAQVLRAVENFRTNSPAPTVPEFNMALEALHETRRAGEPLNPLLETYNDMISRSLLPNLRTYLLLVLALTDRDQEVHKVVTSLEHRSRRRALIGRSETNQNEIDENRVGQLKKENNFGSAMALFEAATKLGNRNERIPLLVYQNLLRSCAHHSNVEAAIHVFAHLEQRTDLLPSANIFTHLIAVYTNVGDISGAKEVFEEFQAAAKSGRLSWGESALACSSQLAVYNKMVESYFRCGQPAGALELLEKMMDSSAGSEAFNPAEIPSPASSTYSAIITGFVRAGDIPTALSWFDRLLLQTEAARNPYESNKVPSRPDQAAWIVILDALASAGMVEDLNRLFAVLLDNASRDGLEVRAIDRDLVLHANLLAIKTLNDKPKAIERLDFLAEKVILSKGPSTMQYIRADESMERIARFYVKVGAAERAIAPLEAYVDAEGLEVREQEAKGQLTSSQAMYKISGQRKLVQSFTTLALSHSTPFSTAIRIARLSDKMNMTPTGPVAPYYLHSYALAKEKDEIRDLTMRDLELIAYAAAAFELPDAGTTMPTIEGFAFKGVVSLLEDYAAQGVDLANMDKLIVRRLIRAVYLRHGLEELQAIFKRLGPDYESVLNDPRRDLRTEETFESPKDVTNRIVPLAGSAIHIDVYHSRFIDEFYPINPVVTPLVAYERFRTGVMEKNVYPVPATIGRLINALGRLGNVDKVRHLYASAQVVLAALENDKAWQSQSWFQIEDQMVIAYAHAGDIESAHIHRIRMLEQGGAPTADAYGALIQCVKDTTDDTSNAVALFQESQASGVPPNIYLYNNIISKLAKARKADFALELFQQMKANNIQPSSITYGAVIAACARVGDTHSAELLFSEMAQQKNFKPRIPPYNTMMQLYTQTKPDRERVLHYYNALLKAGIRPSAHTYKLLIDAYGTIEPVDPEAMEGVFKSLEADPSVQLQGSHWAALINAWGCVRKDLDKAIAVFDSIASHPSTRGSSTRLPDAVTFEAIINVLITHRRTDLIPQYMEHMKSSGVHMTAYIANFLIKGYATCGDLEQARGIFEWLVDPPEGVAAPNNHVPHDPTPAPHIPTATPVYREPSTWEVMIRAELGNGHRDRAMALLERLQARKYPTAVYNRISGIMLDDSAVSPWSPDTTSSFGSQSQ